MIAWFIGGGIALGTGALVVHSRMKAKKRARMKLPKQPTMVGGFVVFTRGIYTILVIKGPMPGELEEPWGYAIRVTSQVQEAKGDLLAADIVDSGTASTFAAAVKAARLWASQHPDMPIPDAPAAGVEVWFPYGKSRIAIQHLSAPAMQGSFFWAVWTHDAPGDGGWRSDNTMNGNTSTYEVAVQDAMARADELGVGKGKP